MRWPFGPPHLTLKPSPKNIKRKQKQKKKKEKRNPSGQENKKTQKHKNTPKKKSFSVISQFFFCFWWVSKISLFWQLGQKNAHPKKHYKNRGFSKAFFEKQICVTKRPFLDKKSQIQKFQLSFFFFCLFLLFQQQKNTKISWNPYFYSVLANLKKIIFKI